MEELSGAGIFEAAAASLR